MNRIRQSAWNPRVRPAHSVQDHLFDWQIHKYNRYRMLPGKLFALVGEFSFFWSKKNETEIEKEGEKKDYKVPSP